jgi:diguanylate cyclase (GGDEF)-like protein
MFGNNRKTIGVFITQAHLEYQKTLCKGISIRAKELGYNVAIFSNFLGYGEQRYEDGEQSIVMLPKYEDLSGIIILPDTMFMHDYDIRAIEVIKARANCPIVSVRQKIDEFYNVLIDDTLVLNEIIQHLIVDHGYKRINFLTGKRENLASHLRLDAFKKIMSEHGLTVEEDQIYFGDFWKEKAYDAVDFWLSDTKQAPEAIVCANDYMALAVCDALEKRGLTIPDDIAVTGCDNIEISESYHPSITTAAISILEMGMGAVEKIDKHNRGIAQEKDTYYTSITKWRESCGCKTPWKPGSNTYKKNRIIEELEAKNKEIYYNSFMSADLTNIVTIEELGQKLASYINIIEGFDSLYICLYKDWEQLGNGDNSSLMGNDDMIMETGIRRGEWLQKTEFSRQNYLPPQYMGDEPQVFFFNILHYQEVCFGYAAISLSEMGAYKSSYQSWLINICNSLENIRINNVLNRLVRRLEDMYIKDDLTGLYNRRALSELVPKQLKDCIDNKLKLLVFSADMDKLKFINDNFGHAGGDTAIKAVADALRSAAREGEICIRVSGDEFVVIGIDYNLNKLERFISDFEQELDRYNLNSKTGFKVCVSYGWTLINPNENTTIEDCLMITDSKMYQEKYKKEALRLRQ